MDKPLNNPRHEKFAQLYTKEPNASKAYRDAGFKATGNGAEVNASKLLRLAKVARRIDFLRSKTEKKLEISREALAKHLWDAIKTPISEINHTSPLAQEYTEEIIGGGDRGKLKRGKHQSGNETTGEIVTRRRVKSMGKVESARLLCEMMGWKEAENIIVDDGPNRIASAKERAMSIASPLNRFAQPAG